MGHPLAPPPTHGPITNLALSDAELEACAPVAGESGKALRAFCPFHGSDRQRSLRVNLATGHFKCFACDAWGYLQRSLDASAPRPASPRHVPRPIAKLPPAPPKRRPELADTLAIYRAALPGSPGADYLRERGIPLEVAQACGVGYAAPGAWAHRDEDGRPLRDWRRGRLVFPHTDPAGNVVNLYGRAVGDVPKEKRHDHLPGAKGYFNAPALREGSGPVAVCEGAFDALALMAAGLERVVAIFGASGWRWEWARDAAALVFALDADVTGQDAWRELGRAGRLRGKDVAFLSPEAYGGRKDVAEAWAAGTLCVGEWPGEAVTVPPSPPVETANEPGAPVPALVSLGVPVETLDDVERLHLAVQLDGARVTVTGLDDRSRHRLMSAIADDHRFDVRMTSTRHDYRGGGLTFFADGPDTAGKITILASRLLKSLEAD